MKIKNGKREKRTRPKSKQNRKRVQTRKKGQQYWLESLSATQNIGNVRSDRRLKWKMKQKMKQRMKQKNASTNRVRFKKWRERSQNLFNFQLCTEYYENRKRNKCVKIEIESDTVGETVNALSELDLVGRSVSWSAVSKSSRNAINQHTFRISKFSRNKNEIPLKSKQQYIFFHSKTAFVTQFLINFGIFIHF